MSLRDSLYQNKFAFGILVNTRYISKGSVFTFSFSDLMFSVSVTTKTLLIIIIFFFNVNANRSVNTNRSVHKFYGGQLQTYWGYSIFASEGLIIRFATLVYIQDC